MTIENTVYGPAWVCCALCGVKQPLGSLEYSKEKLHVCRDGERCKRYQLERAVVVVADAKKDPVLFNAATRSALHEADKLLDDAHRAEPFKTVTTYVHPPAKAGRK